MFLHFLRSLSLHGSSAIRFCNVRFEAWRRRGSWNSDSWSRRLHHVELNFTWSKLGFSTGLRSWLILNIWLGGFTLDVSPKSPILNSYYQKTHMKSKNRTSDLSWRHLMSLGVTTCSFPHLKPGWLDYWFLDRYFEHRNAEFGEHFSCNKRQMLCTRTSLTQRKQHQTTSNKHPPTLRLPMISYNFLPPKTAQTVWVKERPCQLCSSRKHLIIV